MAAKREIPTEHLGEVIAALPGFAEVRDAATRAGLDVHLVGGAVRDTLLGRPANNLDLVVEGEIAPLIEALEGEATVHGRFETAVVGLAGGDVDVARARTETYAGPGELPEVRPATLAEDLVRRDFTVNAIAVPLADPGRIVDPHGGVDDLRLGLLRVFHRRSITDDPTRALRAARYAARLELEPEPGTLELIRAADLGEVSADRVAAELGKLAAEPDPRPGFELLDRWGLLELRPGAAELIGALASLLEQPDWSAVAPRAATVLTAARGVPAAASQLAALEPASPSAAVEAAAAASGVELALARALGGRWLDDYVGRWRNVALSITGEDLIAAGVAQGPAIGRALAAALRAKLDGEAPGRADELRIALDAARS